MISGICIAPRPVSPHMSLFAMHLISWWPHSFNVRICCEVIGCSHILVFIAGQKNNGLPKSHARVVHSTRLSQIPVAIFANVFASSGAINIRSAHLPSSMCNTGSSRFDHCCHSSESPNMGWSSFRGSSLLSTKCLAQLVTMTFICQWNKRPTIYINAHKRTILIQLYLPQNYTSSLLWIV